MLARRVRLALAVVGRPRLAFLMRRMTLERRMIDVAFLGVPWRKGPIRKALARRFAASFAVAPMHLSLAQRLAGFARVRHA
jgi:hypothetical protein